ncbi:uncharacterized protein LOC127175219 [Labeo rohita]|uniref:uncharacterized protein LOC127175219 n=1 Tax=Labeo rohita TaxID=84645 RepID=UPI0021E2425E|nr:uncharacterized protein LOC127175219 [Labeo rohita]
MEWVKKGDIDACFVWCCVRIIDEPNHTCTENKRHQELKLHLHVSDRTSVVNWSPTGYPHWVKSSSFLYGPSSRSPEFSTVMEMQPSEDVPVERPRRQTSLPAHLQDYDLSGYDLHRSLSPPSYSHKPPGVLSPEEDDRIDTPHVAAQHGDYHSPQQWYVADRWDQHMEALREENADLKKLQSDLITTVQQLKEERDDLKQANVKFASQMSQLEAEVKQLLSWQNQQSQPPQASTLSVSCQSKVLDRPKPVPAPRKPRSTEPTVNPNRAPASHDACIAR